MYIYYATHIGASIETILCILESSPYERLTVTGTHYDTALGVFRSSNKAYQQAIDRGDILVKGIMQLMTEKNGPIHHTTAEGSSSSSSNVSKGSNISKVSKGNSVVTKRNSNRSSSGNGMSNAKTYGFGTADQYTGHNYDPSDCDDDDDDNNTYTKSNNNNNTYTNITNKDNINISIHKLSQLCILTRDETCLGLYRLQQQGVLTYRLIDLCVYIETTCDQGDQQQGQKGHNYDQDGEGSEGGVGEMGHNSDHPYENTMSNDEKNVLQLSIQLYKQLYTMHQNDYTRIQSMYNVSQLIAHYTSSSENKDTNKGHNSDHPSFETDQVEIRRQLNALLFQTNSNDNTSNNNTVPIDAGAASSDAPYIDSKDNSTSNSSDRRYSGDSGMTLSATSHTSTLPLLSLVTPLPLASLPYLSYSRDTITTATSVIDAQWLTYLFPTAPNPTSPTSTPGISSTNDAADNIHSVTPTCTLTGVQLACLQRDITHLAQYPQWQQLLAPLLSTLHTSHTHITPDPDLNTPNTHASSKLIWSLRIHYLSISITKILHGVFIDSYSGTYKHTNSWAAEANDRYKHIHFFQFVRYVYDILCMSGDGS